MRITILSGSVPTTTFIDALVNAMAEDGKQVTVIGKQTGSWNYHSGVQIIIVPEGFIGRLFFIVTMFLKNSFRHTAAIWKQSSGLHSFYKNLLFYLPIIHSKPDKIHIQWAAFIHNKDLLFDLYPGKVLVSLRGAHINYTPITTPDIRKSYERLFPHVHRFHAVSKAIAKEAFQYGSAMEKTDVIYSFVNNQLLNKNIKTKKVGEKLHIISIGRFFWKKGYEYALDALNILHLKGVDFSYTLIAMGATPASIIYQLHQLGIKDKVNIINGTTHNEVLVEIEKHDVLLHPSVEEGVANVVIESMAVGTPVITTDAGGMSEIVIDKKTGFLVKLRDVQGIATSLLSFSKLNAEERFAVAMHAKQQIQQRHDKETFVKLFRKFYDN